MKGQPKLTGFGYFGLLLMFIGAAIWSAICMMYLINKAELSTALLWGESSRFQAWSSLC